MASDCYRVEILHFLNPHVLWVEVHSDSKDDFNFEQIGLFGVLPLEFTIDILDKTLKTKRSKDWIPAASARMITLLDGAKEVWFTTTLIDQRNTIFDDNIYKFGELIIISSDDTQTHLSKALVDGGFAMYDSCIFHQDLANGKLNIKLSHVQTEEVLKQFKRYYRKKNKQKEYENSLKKQTTVSRTAIEIQSNLTVANLERHNLNQLDRNMLAQKLRELQLCKGIDEQSVGRACKTQSSDKVEVKSGLLKKKLGMAKEIDKQGTPAVMFNVAKEYIECNAVKKRVSNTSSSKEQSDMNEIKENVDEWTNNDEDEPTEFGHNTKVEVKKEKSPVKMPHYPGPPDTEKVIKSPMDLVKNSKVVKKEKYAVKVDRPPTSPVPNKVENAQTSPVKIPASVAKSPQNDSSKVANPMSRRMGADQTVIFGPPELNHFLQKVHKVAPKITQSMKRVDIDEKNNTTSNFLQKKCLILKEKEFHKKPVSSKTANKSLNSSDTDKSDAMNDSRDDDSDKQELEELEMKLSEEYKPFLVKPKKQNLPIYFANDKNYANPFNNVNPDISVFVDKLVTPVLMLHNKMNRRIVPKRELREVPFNQHIHAVLRNMRVIHPMLLQTVSWSTVLRGHSLFMIGSIGSGKTMGYLPAVCRLVTDSQVDCVGSVGPIAIIVCATSKSVTEIINLAKMFLGLKEKVLACYAGMEEFHITTSLLNGCDLMICTPSVLVRLLQKTDFGVDLRRLATFVLDDCERLAEVYAKEIKFFQLKIKEMLKNRANKELKVQYILASRVWCDFMEPLAKKAPDTVVCIGAFQECVLYSKTPTSVKFVTKENKPQAVLDFLREIDISKRIVIVCRSDDDVEMMEKVLAKERHTVYACNNTMTVNELYNLNLAWADYQDPVLGPILLCCDNNLVHMNITDACYLLHYSLPQLFSTFSKRFAVLNDNYPSMFNTEITSIKVRILVDDTNVEQLPKILNFIKRCTSEIPETLQDISKKVLAEKDLAKAENYVPVCNNLLALGECPDFWNCQERHTVYKEFDEPKEWMPKNGMIAFKVLHYHTAVFYSVRLMSHTENGLVTRYQQTYNTLSLKMGMFYSKESNKRPHGKPRVGDICAVALKLNYYARCQVLKILNYHPNDTPNYVFIKLIDEEKYERTQDLHLYHLPDDLKKMETHVVQVRLANIQPKDKDVTFSELARRQLKKITDEDDDLFLRGKVSLAVGNCLFGETLEACQALSLLNETVVKHDFKNELLNAHAIVNAEHVTKLLVICADVRPQESFDESPVEVTDLPVAKIQVKPQWAHLEQDIFSSVYFTSAVSPAKFFVRLAKFADCMNILIKDIQKYLSDNPDLAPSRNVDDIVLAKFPDDGIFERARIDNIVDKKVKCFFVDHGDWRDVDCNDVFPITDKLITQMPFQAIECRLIGVKPFGDDWTEFSTNWFYDQCCEDNQEYLKNLSVKYFTKEHAESSGGHKYGVVLIDTTGKDDIIINKLLIDASLATEIDDEIHHLNNLTFTRNEEAVAESDEDEWEKVSHNKIESIPSSDRTEISITPSLLLRQPTRSMPLVADDSSSDSDKWDMNMSEEFLSTFKPIASQSVEDKNLTAIKESQSTSEYKLSAFEENQPNPDDHTDKEPSNQEKVQNIESLDSDDLTTPENSELLSKPILVEKRKPRLVWRQTKTTITAKILLICDEYHLKIDQTCIRFSSQTNDTEYEFEVDLYGVLDVPKCRHSNKGQYILVNLIKLLPRNWLSFSNEVTGNKWIAYDVDSIDTSSDEEEVDKDNLVNIVKNMRTKTQSESEDDAFLDDVEFTYRK